MDARRRLQFGEAFVGLGILCAAIFAVALIVWLNIGRLEVVDAADRQARETLATIDVIDEALLDQEAGLRAYVVGAEPQFLHDYLDGGKRLGEAVATLSVQTADEPQQRDRATLLLALSKGWTDSVATPEVALVKAGALAHARTMVVQQSGERQMRAINKMLADLRRAEHDLLVMRSLSKTQAFVTARWALVLGALGSLAAATLLGGRWFFVLARSRDAAEAANRAKTRFLANMSHEIRTPLNGVSGVAEALARSGLDPRQLALVDTIRRSAAAVDARLGDILALSRDGDEGEVRIAPFQLAEIARSALARVREAAEAKGLDLVADVADEAEVWVEGDAQRLAQVLDRLLSNAVKFTERGGVRLKLIALAEARYRFEVTDTGAGFDPAQKRQLFDPFAQSDDTATRRHEGAGLGLAIASKRALQIGASLDCDSTPGRGSSFTVDLDLPRASAAPSVSATTADDQVAGEPSEPADEPPFRVLIVDDHPTNRQVLELILEQLGAEWLSVEDGQQAVAAAARESFAAILMDIQMPVMDGLEATREIRKAERESGRPATPVIIVSANCQPEHVTEGVEAGAQRHLSKPVNAQSLIGALSDVLDVQQEAA